MDVECAQPVKQAVRRAFASLAVFVVVVFLVSFVVVVAVFRHACGQKVVVDVDPGDGALLLQGLRWWTQSVRRPMHSLKLARTYKARWLGNMCVEDTALLRHTDCSRNVLCVWFPRMSGKQPTKKPKRD